MTRRCPNVSARTPASGRKTLRTPVVAMRTIVIQIGEPVIS